MEINESKNIHEIGVNVYIRESIKKNYGTEMNLSGISLIDYDMSYFRSVLDSLKLKTDKDVLVFNIICSLAFLDSYKIVSNKVKKNTATEFDINEYSMLSTVSNSEDLRKYYLSGKDQLLYGLDSIISFKDMPIINKIDIIKNLTDEENMRLNRISPLHQNDLDKYNRKIDKELLYRYYSNYKAELEDKTEIDCMKAVTTMTINFLKDLYFVEPKETKELINSISNDVFNNINKFREIYPSCENLFDNLNKLYEKSGNTFGFICLKNLDILEIVLGYYYSMRDNKIIKGKTYGKKQ